MTIKSLKYENINFLDVQTFETRPLSLRRIWQPFGFCLWCNVDIGVRGGKRGHEWYPGGMEKEGSDLDYVKDVTFASVRTNFPGSSSTYSRHLGFFNILWRKTSSHLRAKGGYKPSHIFWYTMLVTWLFG